MRAGLTRPGLCRVEQIMGTAITVDLADDLPPATLRELADQVFAWMHEVDARFSTYRPDSEVCRFDRGEVLLSEASAELRFVLEACADLWGATDGFFDAYATGRLDPSGFVKGWAAQVASDRLLAAGAGNHCVNAGGDVRVRGLSPSGEPWRIGIRHPGTRWRPAWCSPGPTWRWPRPVSTSGADTCWIRAGARRPVGCAR
nr:FAD:protein FMN transferase [Micromonospora tarensis]